jgi:hypothetical protein
MYCFARIGRANSSRVVNPVKSFNERLKANPKLYKNIRRVIIFLIDSFVLSGELSLESSRQK